jgi:hypothetical protein
MVFDLFFEAEDLSSRFVILHIEERSHCLHRSVKAIITIGGGMPNSIAGNPAGATLHHIGQMEFVPPRVLVNA